MHLFILIHLHRLWKRMKVPDARFSIPLLAVVFALSSFLHLQERKGVNEWVATAFGLIVISLSQGELSRDQTHAEQFSTSPVSLPPTPRWEGGRASGLGALPRFLFNISHKPTPLNITHAKIIKNSELFPWPNMSVRRRLEINWI